MQFSELPQEIRNRLLSIAQNHPGTSAIDLYAAMPENLRDSASEITHWIDTHEWSHIIPKSMGGVDAIWETTAGHPNQVRGDHPMTINERMRIEEQNYFDSINIDAQYNDDIGGETMDEYAQSSIPDWSTSLDQALIGAGLVGVSGYAIAFTFRVARNVIAHRSELLKNREFRKSFLIKTLEQAHQQGIRGGVLAFVVAFICIVFPPFKFLLFSGCIVGLGRLGLEILRSVIGHVDPEGLSMMSRVFDFSISAFNLAASVLAMIWVVLNRVVDWIAQGLTSLVGIALRIGTHVFRSIGRMMDWLLGAPTIACEC